MVKDYAESILQAVEIVVGKCLNDVAFDKTEICTIVSDADKKNGRYTVTNGSAKYDAFVNTSNNADSIPEYKVNDSVRVSVPNGDYSQKKYIEGLNVVDNDACPITYVSPLDTVLDMTDNIISGEKIRGLRANDINQSEWCIWSADCSQPDYRKLQNNSLYDTIAIKGDFKTLLTGYNVNSGSYGLRLDMYFKPTNGTDKLIKHSAYLDSSDMYGNPYSFLIYSTQAVKFSIANIGTIQTISLYFYQKNNFTYLTDEGIQKYLPVLRAEDPDYSNLLLKNVYLSFGSDIVNIDDNTVKLYTNEPLEYDRLAEDESANTKGIGLLWYNKNDAGQYLGYSDGIAGNVQFRAEDGTLQAAEPYDEIKYLQMSEKDSRLLAQQGKDVPLDKSGLDLSADIVEAEKLLKKLKISITQDLYQMLWAFQSRIEGVVNDKDNDENNLAALFDNLLDSQAGLIAAAGEDLEDNTEDIVNYYLAKLSNARAKMDEAEYEPTELSYTLPDKMMKSPQDVVTAIKSGDNNNPGLLESAYTIIKNHYAGFMSLYDSFNIKLSKLVATTQSYIDEFLALTEGNQARIEAYFKDGYDYKPYVTEVDETLYENRYCIYWYRYIPGYINETERFMDSGWKRLTEYNNYGLPSATTNVDGIEYYEKRPDVGEDSIIQILDTELSEEKYCVIIFYNHTMYKSEPLVFTNQNPPQDGAASDQYGALYIEHGNNSRDTYQSYGVNNMLINVADAYQTRTLNAHYEGIMGQDEVLAGGQVFWYIPKNATMLTYDLNEYGTDFTNDIYDSVQSPNSMEGYTCFYRTIKESDDALTFTYHIKDYYVPTSTNNDIICKVITKDNRILEANIMFNFSSYGTSGTDYTLVITPAGFKNAITEEYDGTGEDKFFEFNVSLYDYNNEKMDIPVASLIQDECRFIGPTSHPYEVTWLSNGIPIEELDDSTENMLTGCKVWIINPDKGPAKQYYYGILQVAIEFKLPEMVDENGVVTQKERAVNLTSFYALPFSSNTNSYQGEIYIEGASIVVYDSSGVNPVYYKNPYKAYSNHLRLEGETQIVEKDAEILPEELSWTMMYYNEDGDKIDISSLDEENKHKYQLLINWMPKLSSDNKLVPANMYLAEHPESETHLYPVVVCLRGQDVIWAQPIYLMQNRYESAKLNAWDGSLCIDEENGSIMASMVGAGRKTKNNTFEGVLMGDVGAVADIYSDNAEGLGLYGFHDGAQSFHFGIDGTGFIGKAGRGRIILDGNKGRIMSASYAQTRTFAEDGTCTGADAGMLIDLDDGIIDIRGVMADGSDKYGEEAYVADGYSSHITLNAKADAELMVPYFRISTPNITKENAWIDKDLIYIGLDKYFLQSENYEEGTFDTKDNQPNSPGSGMKIDLQGAFIDAFNLRLQSQNLLIDCVNEDGPFFVIKSGATDKELTSFRNLMYVGIDTYYLQTADYKEDTSGLKIDLANGTIKAYNSFSLEAGTETNGGVMLNANPGSGENYLFAGKTSVGYIKIDNNGNMSLMATVFTLKTNKGDGQDIYLSNTITSWTVNNASKSNILLGIGTNFAVDNKGNLYANNATINNLTAVGGTFSGTISATGTISGGTITGATIDGAIIYADELHAGGTNHDMLVANATSVTIKGADISAGGGDGGASYGFSGTGQVNAKDAIFEAITVKKSAFFTDTCKVGINANPPTGDTDLLVKGATEIQGNLYMGAGTGTGDIISKNAPTNKISWNGGVWVYGDICSLFSTKVQIGYGENISSSGGVDLSGSATVAINGKTYLNGTAEIAAEVTALNNFLYKGDIKCWDGSVYKSGVDGTYKVETGGWSSKKLTFKKGILVEINGSDDDDTTSKITYDVATTSSLGCVKLGDSTSRTISGKTYGVAMNSSNQLCVYVPWENTEPTSVSYATNAGNVLVSGGNRGYVATVPSGSGQYRYIGVGPSVSSLSGESSLRFKENIHPISNSDILYQLNPVSYYYKKEKDYGSNMRYGFIAEDVAEIANDLVERNPEDPMLCESIYYNSILTLAVAEIQKLRKELDDLKSNL